MRRIKPQREFDRLGFRPADLQRIDQEEDAPALTGCRGGILLAVIGFCVLR
jgi:hypothetical protein